MSTVALPSSRRITPADVSEFLNILLLVSRDHLRDLGLDHSVATGRPLPEGNLRIDTALDPDAEEILWGISGKDEARTYEYQECGYQMSPGAFNKVVRILESHLDASMLAQSNGTPVVRRVTISERSSRPRLPEDAAVVVRNGKRQFLPSFPWRPNDPFALGGKAAREAAELADLLSDGRAEMFLFPGGGSLVVDTSPATATGQPRHGRAQ